MFLEKIILKNFRNYETQSIDFCDGVNIIAGLNAQGKTNILEAINIISTGRSHRTRKDNEIIKWEGDISEIKAFINSENDLKKVEYRFNREKKKHISVNGVKLEKISEILGNLYTVIFSADHLAIVKEGPGERRRFMDVVLSQLKHSYYHALINYLKVLDLRNRTLIDSREDQRKRSLIDVWDEQLVKYGIRILLEREEFIKDLDSKAKLICREISGGLDDLKIKYLPSVLEKTLISDRIECGEKFLEETFLKKLLENRNGDIKKGHTSVGPHRDDFALLINGRDVRNYGSQGQQRTVLLAIKISELQIMGEVAGSNPILLLDDVFSELDSTRKEFLLKYLKGVQSIITCTDADVIMGLREIKPIKYFFVEKGIVSDSTFEEINNVISKR